MKVKNVISSAEFNMIVSLTALVVIITLVVRGYYRAQAKSIRPIIPK